MSEATPEKQQVAALEAADVTTPAADSSAADASESQVVLVPGDDGEDKPVRILSHVRRAHRNSETRTPIIVTTHDGEPFPSVVALAREQGCTVWSIQMGSERNERNAMDYIEVGTQNGDWVYLTNVENASWEVLRQIGLDMYTLKPEPKRFPRRDLFRLFLVTERPINVNDHVKPIFPQALLQNAIVARAKIIAGAKPDGSGSPEKIQRRFPADVPLFESTTAKHVARREQNRDSDSESDMEEPEKKATGMWFHRAVEFFDVDGEGTIARVNEVIFDAIDQQNTQLITDLCNSGRLNIETVKRNGMNPLMYAVSREKANSVKALIANNADVHAHRESDSSPLLFMCIESEDIVTALIEAGGNVDERYEGYRLEDHPLTMPHIAKLIRNLKGLPPAKNTTALELASSIGSSSREQPL